VRLRIIKSVKGEIDGIPLDHYRIDEIYDVGSSLAAYLLVTGAAVPASDDPPDRVTPDFSERREAADRKSTSRPRIARPKRR
jgi:hypothetical protein